MLAHLKQLSKIHYHWAFLEQYIPDAERLDQIVRICGAASVDPGRQSEGSMDRIIATAQRHKVSVGLVYSPWHQTWRPGLPPTEEGTAHMIELRKMFDDFEKVRILCSDRDVAVSAVLLDCEQWTVKPDDAKWNQALTRKHNAAYDIVKLLFPDAVVDWYGSGIQRSAAPSGWSKSNLFTGNERRDTMSCDIYAAPEIDRMRETYRLTVHVSSHPVVTPWIALGSGMKPQLVSMHGWVDRWDYDLEYSWLLGREINNAWFWDRPDRFAPWDRAKFAMFYPQPWRSDVWEKHFVAYCLGAAQSKRLTLD